MRHSRSADFDRALADAPARSGAQRWSDLASDPNDPAAVAWRAATLRAAWRPPIANRVRFLEDRCRGRRVLDIGCVAHDVARLASPDWLHGRLAAVAARCVGVDVLEDGVEEMRRRGYTVLVHDLTAGVGPVADHAPFDVIVAGELIEHVESLGMLFDTARTVLAPGGELIVTTPNPYGAWRVRAARRGIVWENVDHIVYAFPSGIAELAERHGMTLVEAAVTDDRRRLRPTERLRAIKRRILGRQWTNVGFATTGEPRVQRAQEHVLATWMRKLHAPRPGLHGETFVYVVRTHTASPASG